MKNPSILAAAAFGLAIVCTGCGDDPTASTPSPAAQPAARQAGAPAADTTTGDSQAKGAARIAEGDGQHIAGATGDVNAAKGQDTSGIPNAGDGQHATSPAASLEDPQAKGAARTTDEAQARNPDASPSAKASSVPLTTANDGRATGSVGSAAEDSQTKGAARAIDSTTGDGTAAKGQDTTGEPAAVTTAGPRTGTEAKPAVATTGETTRPADATATRTDADGTTVGEGAKGVVGMTTDPVTAERNRQEAAQHAPDDTGRNARDRNADAVTPMDQSESRADIDITAEIRRAIVANDEFSSLAKNIKIITKDGNVVLRGPVATSSEVVAIREIALGVRGVHMVDNDLEVVR